MSVVVFALWIAAAPASAIPTPTMPTPAARGPETGKPATAPAKPAAAPPRTGPVSTLIRSETFKRSYLDQPQSFRVDYTASLTWTLADRKSCYFGRCRPVCDLTVSHKVLSRQLWWTQPAKPPVLAEDNHAQREYFGGVITFGRTCKAVSDRDVARAAADRLRPYQFADELIRDRPLLLKSADDYLALTLPPPNPPASAPPQPGSPQPAPLQANAPPL